MLAEMDNSLPKTHSPFRFTLGMLFYAMALLAAAMGAFGVFFGILIGGVGIIFLLVPASRVTIIATVIVGVFLVGWFLAAIPSEKNATRFHFASPDLRIIGLALASYAKQEGSLPPASIRDADGKPMHSWRVLVLPYLKLQGAQDLYDKYDLREPWDGPNNSQLIAQIPWFFEPPNRNAPVGHTSCLAIVGKRNARRRPGLASSTGAFRGVWVIYVSFPSKGGCWMTQAEGVRDEFAQGCARGVGPVDGRGDAIALGVGDGGRERRPG